LFDVVTSLHLPAVLELAATLHYPVVPYHSPPLEKKLTLE
jgi:hypothetical protein